MSDDRPKPLAPPNSALPSYRTYEERRSEREARFGRFFDHADAAAYLRGESRSQLATELRALTADGLECLMRYAEAAREMRSAELSRRQRDSHERFARMIAINIERVNSNEFRIAMMRPLEGSFLMHDPDEAVRPPEIQTYAIPIRTVQREAMRLITHGYDPREAWLRATHCEWRRAVDAGAWGV